MSHEFDGEKYKQASSHQKEWGNRIIAETHLQGHERILDLGCGDGVLTAQLADLVPKGSVLGIDASQGMIETAAKIQRRNLSFKLQDIKMLDYSEEFDLVFSNATLHWIKDHHRLLQNVIRCLRPGGVARFNFGGAGNCVNFIHTVKAAMQQPAYSWFFSSFEWPWYMPSMIEYQALAQQFPFQECRVWEENADRYFPDAGSITGWIDQPSIVPFLEHLPEPSRAEFRNYVVENVVRQTLQPDGRCFETFRRINLMAKK